MKRLVIFGLTYYLIINLLISEGISSTACLKTGGPHLRTGSGAGGLSVVCAFHSTARCQKGKHLPEMLIMENVPGSLLSSTMNSSKMNFHRHGSDSAVLLTRSRIWLLVPPSCYKPVFFPR